MRTRRRHLFLMGTLVLGGASTASAQTSLLGDVVADLRTDSVAMLSIDGATTALGVTFGEAIITLLNPGCVVPEPSSSEESNVRGCSADLRRFMAGFSSFEVDTTAGHFTITEPVVRLEAPVVVRDTGFGFTIPAGTLMTYSAKVSGIFSDGSTLDAMRIMDTQPLTSDAVFHLSTATQELVIDGSFPFFIGTPGDSISGTVVLMASAETPFVNVPPIAEAGPDLTVACGQQATLDGSASIDENNNITFYRWNADGAVIATGVVAPMSMPLGTTTVTLEVRDAWGGTGLDSVDVTVVPSAPVFSFVPPTVTASTCGALNIGQAQATACGGGAVTITNDAPATFPVGRRVVTWTATGATGLVTRATQEVVVFPGNSASCCPAGSRVIVGTSNNDTLTGTAGVDCIIGLGGQDTINGLGGNDIISGGDGDDVISGGAGNDLMSGGSGQDRLSGNDGNDTLSGNDGDDRLDGGNNDDSLFGGQGQDQLICGPGNDRAFGNDGDDRLEGGTGNDILDGGANQNACFSGGGTDQFLLCTTVG